MFDLIYAHLKESETTYFGHLVFALRAGILMIYAGVASIVHALLPCLFPATAARVVAGLYRQRLKDHPNPEYQRFTQDMAP